MLDGRSRARRPRCLIRDMSSNAVFRYHMQRYSLRCRTVIVCRCVVVLSLPRTSLQRKRSAAPPPEPVTTSSGGIHTSSASGNQRGKRADAKHMPVQYVAPAILVGINLNKDGIPDVLQQPQVSHAAPIQHGALAQKRAQVNHAAQARNELGLHSRRLSAIMCEFAVIRSPSSPPSLHPQRPPTQEGVGGRCGRCTAASQFERHTQLRAPCRTLFWEFSKNAGIRTQSCTLQQGCGDEHAARARGR